MISTRQEQQCCGSGPCINAGGGLGDRDVALIEGHIAQWLDGGVASRCLAASVGEHGRVLAALAADGASVLAVFGRYAGTYFVTDGLGDIVMAEPDLEEMLAELP